MIDLSSYGSVTSALFVKWDIPDFEIAYISDYSSSVTFGGNTYTNIGRLLGITAVSSELKASPNELSISLSGIPTDSVSNVLTKEIKGSTVEIYRGFFNASTGTLLSLGSNPILKFKGIVTNYDVSDDVDIAAQIATTTITLACASDVEVLSNKVSGRRTNPVDFPDEDSMNRVTALANSNFNFGAPAG